MVDKTLGLQIDMNLQIWNIKKLSIHNQVILSKTGGNPLLVVHLIFVMYNSEKSKNKIVKVK